MRRLEELELLDEDSITDVLGEITDVKVHLNQEIDMEELY